MTPTARRSRAPPQAGQALVPRASLGELLAKGGQPLIDTRLRKPACDGDVVTAHSCSQHDCCRPWARHRRRSSRHEPSGRRPCAGATPPVRTRPAARGELDSRGAMNGHLRPSQVAAQRARVTVRNGSVTLQACGRPQTNRHVERLRRTILKASWHPASARVPTCPLPGLKSENSTPTPGVRPNRRRAGVDAEHRAPSRPRWDRVW